MKNINDYIRDAVDERDALMDAGIDSPTALEIVSNGLQSSHLIECLEQLKVYQAEELIHAMRRNIYSFKGKKGTYAYAGCSKFKESYQFHFIDNAFGIDEVLLTAEEVCAISDGRIQSDLLRAIKEVQ